MNLDLTIYTKINAKWIKDLDTFGDPRCVFESWLGLHSPCDFGRITQLIRTLGSTYIGLLTGLDNVYENVTEMLVVILCPLLLLFFPKAGGKRNITVICLSSCFHWRAVHILLQGTSGTIPRVGWSRKQIGAVTVWLHHSLHWSPPGHSAKCFHFSSTKYVLGTMRVLAHIYRVLCARDVLSTSQVLFNSGYHPTIQWGRFSYELQLTDDKMMQRAVKQLAQGDTNYKNIDSNTGSVTLGLFLTAASFCCCTWRGHFIPKLLCEGREFYVYFTNELRGPRVV